MGRVGRKPERMTRAGRLKKTHKVVRELTSRNPNHRVTMRQVAARMGLRPSSYVMELLSELWELNLISHDAKFNTRRNVVYYWYCEQEDLCSAPWKCPETEIKDSCKIAGISCPLVIMGRSS